MEKICVAIRVRPPTKPECQSAKGYKWRVGQHSVTLYSTLGTPVNGQSFAFDHVFGTETKNADIYHGLSKEVIMSTLSGFNGIGFLPRIIFAVVAAEDFFYSLPNVTTFDRNTYDADFSADNTNRKDKRRY